MLCIVILPAAVSPANIISQKPRGFYITFRKGKYHSGQSPEYLFSVDTASIGSCKKKAVQISQSPIRMFFSAGIRCNPTIGVAPFSLFQAVSLYSCEFALILAIRLLISSSVGMSISPIAVK